MLFNVKVEALTYLASPFEGDASAPLILGRPEMPLGARHEGTAPSGSGPSFAAQLWCVLSFQILAYFSSMTQCLLRQDSGRAPLVTRYGDDNGPCCVVRLNRSLKRKLRRLQRRGLIGASRLCAEAPQLDSLTRTQRLEHMIRAKKLSRVKVYRLGFGRRDLRRLAVMGAGLQGALAALEVGIMCRAPLSPD